MFKPIVRLLAFFGKEFNEVRRQPRLVLSLILGPFLILLLFGVGYTGQQPKLRVALVVPPEELSDPRIEIVGDIIGGNFELVEVTTDEEVANQMLARGEVDVVEVFPSGIEERLANGEQVWVAFRYNEINPIDEQWMQYTGYVQSNALNQAFLMQTAGQMQDEAAETNILLAVADEQLGSLSEDSNDEEKAEARQTLGELQIVVAALAANPAAAREVLGEEADPEELSALQADLAALDQAIANDEIDKEQARIEETRARVQRMEELTRTLSETPSDVLVTPIQIEYQNARPALELVDFYAPGVLALILQHIAVTLGALSLVRERLLGALEMFSVSPTNMINVLLGKIGAYTVFVGLIATLLAALLVFGLQVPFLGSLTEFGITMLLFLLASIGVGLLLSTLSNSDTQAVQLSMIVLLLSIFFSGFFLPLEQFRPAARWIGYALPVTHGMNSFINIMLLERTPDQFSWMMFGVIIAVTLFLVIILWGRQFRRLR